MSFFQEDGVLTSRTSSGTDVVTLTGSGASLDVKLVRLVTNGATATGFANTDKKISYGFGDGTSDAVTACVSQDGVDVSVAYRKSDNSVALRIFDPDGTETDTATISAVGNGTFTVNWSLKSGTAYLVKWTAWGGSDITGIELVEFTSPTTATTQNVSTTLKSADVGFFFGHSNQNAGQVHALTTIGFADKDLNQGCVGVSSKYFVDTTDTDRITHSDNCIGTSWADAEFETANLTAFDATHGIQLNWSNVVAIGYVYQCVLVKGGQWEVGSGTTNTSATTKSFATTFQPVGLSVINTSSSSLGTVQSTVLINLGSTDGTSEGAVGAGGNNAGDTSDCAISFHTTYTLATITMAGGGLPLGLAKFDSFNALDFTLDWTDDADSANRDFVWMVCAGNPVAPETFGSKLKFNRLISLVGNGVLIQ